MAAHPVVVIDEEVLARIPEEFRDDPRFQKGARLELVPLERVHTQAAIRPLRDWRDLEGILADSDADPNAELEAERLRELAKESR